eukprot:2419346-Amphidinium_carterae.2
MSAAESDDFVIQVWGHQPSTSALQAETPGRSLQTFGDSSYNGVRDAAQSFENAINETLTANGLKQGAFSPCVYHRKEHKVGVMHHGDDFVAVGPRRATPKVGEALSTVFMVKDRGVLGPRPGDLKQIR